MKLQAVRGMPDILPDVTSRWQAVEASFQKQVQAYGFSEIRLPIVESVSLFKRGVGEVTDIVEKEMYVFEDRNGESLALRPEGTAGCVRAALEHGLIYNQTQKLWYRGPMFRHERPQKGRYRQFHHLGLEVFGLDSPLADAELIQLTAVLLSELRVKDHVRLLINTLGTPEERQVYRKALVAYLTPFESQLDEDARRRLKINPLRILDSKNPDMQAIIQGAPKLLETLGEPSRRRFESVCALLMASGVAFEVHPRLVRGLDYYSHTVFEWVTTTLGAQGTVLAGGRYDGLVEQLGGQSTPAIGCALGVERLVLMQEALQVPLHPPRLPSIYVIFEEEISLPVFQVVSEWRQQYPHWQFILNLQGGNFKKQFQRANKLEADYAFILTAQNLQERWIEIKTLIGVGMGSQIEMPMSGLQGWFLENKG